MGLLTANYPPRSSTEEQGDALLSAWWLALHGKDERDSRGMVATVGGKPWITDVIFDRAVDECLTSVKGFLPAVAEFIGICGYAKASLEAEAEAHRPLLPAPPRREVDEIDPDDPYSCTPAERERWAREDQWIRQWAARFPKSLPDYAPADEFDAWQRNLSVAGWPSLKPIERRAKERRIAAEREIALKDIWAALAKARGPLAGALGGMRDVLEDAQGSPVGKRVRIEWSDGVVTEPLVGAVKPEPPLSATKFSTPQRGAR